MTEQISSGTARGAIEYLDTLVQKGRARKGVVVPLKTALTKVLETTEGETWGGTDVTNLDIEDAMTRFKNLTMAKYTADSYQAYRSRMIRTISWYKTFLENPGWTPPQKPTGSSTEASTKSIKAAGSVKPKSSSSMSVRAEVMPAASPAFARPSVAPTVQDVDAITYPFPLANGKIARFHIPAGMAKSDVARVAAFLDALVIDSGAPTTDKTGD